MLHLSSFIFHLSSLFLVELGFVIEHERYSLLEATLLLFATLGGP